MSTDYKKDFLKKFGTNLKNIRQKKGISRKDLVDKLKTSQSYIANIELGKISPSILKAALIAQALNIELTELFEFGESLPPA